MLHFTFSPESLILLEEINGRDAYEAHVAGEHGRDPQTIAFPFGEAGNVTFPITKLMVWRGPNPRFSGKSIMCYVVKHK